MQAGVTALLAGEISGEEVAMSSDVPPGSWTEPVRMVLSTLSVSLAGRAVRLSPSEPGCHEER
jgi:hypothetical protein